MKKLLSLMLVLTMALSLFAACGRKDEPAPTEPEQTTEETTQEQHTEDQTTQEQPTEDQTADEVAVPGSALEILENIWGNYAEEEKFAIMGGNAESGIFDAPGVYDLAYAENLTYNLLVPADVIPNVDQAASMIHAMNANTFTCGAFHVTAPEGFAEAMNEAIAGNMWMCGFPERQVVASLGDGYFVVAFGVSDAMTPFFTHLQEVYPEAEILFDEPIA